MGASLQHSAISRGRGRRHKHQPMGEINVTPFVDVMLVLLIIFMVTAPLLSTGVELSLPKASTPSVQGSDEPLNISVTELGEVYLEDQLIALDSVAERITAVLQESTDVRIFVRGDTNVDYGTVMQVIALIHEAGYRNIGLLTQQP